MALRALTNVPDGVAASDTGLATGTASLWWQIRYKGSFLLDKPFDNTGWVRHAFVEDPATYNPGDGTTFRFQHQFRKISSNNTYAFSLSSLRNDNSSVRVVQTNWLNTDLEPLIDRDTWYTLYIHAWPGSPDFDFLFQLIAPDGTVVAEASGTDGAMVHPIGTFDRLLVMHGSPNLLEIDAFAFGTGKLAVADRHVAPDVHGQALRWWPYKETSGSTVAEETGNGQALIISGTESTDYERFAGDWGEGGGGVTESISGTSAGESSDSATVSAQASLVGDSVGESSDEGTLTAVGAVESIEGESPGLSEDSAAPSLGIEIEGNSLGASSDSASASVTTSLVGESAGDSTDEATIVVKVLLTGESIGESLDEGTATTADAHALEGESVGASLDEAGISLELSLVGDSPGASSDEAGAILTILISGESVGSSEDTAVLGGKLIGESLGTSSDTATVSLKYNLTGDSEGLSLDTAGASIEILIEGTSTGGSFDRIANAPVVELTGVSVGESLDAGTITAKRRTISVGYDLGSSLDIADPTINVVGTIFSIGSSLDRATVSIKQSFTQAGWSHGFSSDSGTLTPRPALGPGEWPIHCPPTPIGNWEDCVDDAGLEVPLGPCPTLSEALPPVSSIEC